MSPDPSHDRDYSLTGLLIMAFFGGIRAGVSRDILLNHIPSPLKDPKYILVCILMGLPGLANYRHAESREEHFRKRALAFKSFTLPWYAILGAHKSLDHGAGIYTAITIGLISTTAGGVFIDLCSDVTPEVLRPCEHVLTTAALATTTYVLLAKYELRTAPAIPVTFNGGVDCIRLSRCYCNGNTGDRSFFTKRPERVWECVRRNAY